METEARTCPCCGEDLPLGLFSASPGAALPAAVAQLIALGEEIDLETIREGFVYWGERAFMQVHGSLPLQWGANGRESPVGIVAWIECEERWARRAQALSQGKGRELIIHGHLASDLPGFPGTLGARATVSCGPRQEPRLRVVTDPRLMQLQAPRSHEEFINLYRSAWGNDSPVVEANSDLRNDTYDAWRRLIDRPSFRIPIAPPPAISGIAPGEVLVAPPIDTGGEAILATIGCAEAADDDQTPTELCIFIRDPSDEFIHCFGEFCYFSRVSSTELEAGTVVFERQLIPGSEDMHAWLTVEPWWLEGFDGPDGLRFLAAIPLRDAESRFVELRGPAALIDAFETSDVDLSDILRDSVVDL